ncbi:LysR family transcriptional regulator substrate-binding protein [Gordonia sp. i37]|uniref:LysR family transcriptional regulator substrate-binding protein n=1 Tax=Gordonia sp. i37 TaxID=1961707 RepID=UPI0009AD8335|nr:LysR family transcriptional regulator substrate-binding protein [Gordonia sp. i37]OPX06394.1 LysR family transcriptional regulator [Gordonia sp. i37]
MTPPADAEPSGRAVFRLAYVPGVTPGKWVRIWSERHPDVALQMTAVDVADTAPLIGRGDADMALTRLPDALTRVDPGPHHTIVLYEETTVVVFPKDHLFAAADDLAPHDLADENLLWPLDEPLVVTDRPGTDIEHRPETTADAIELVASGIGLLLVPQSLARLHHRRDLTYRPVTGVPTSAVGLLWQEPTSELADQFIGIVRGRRPSSSRGTPDPSAKRSAKEKTAAKRAAREASGKGPSGKTPGASNTKGHKPRRRR